LSPFNEAPLSGTLASDAKIAAAIGNPYQPASLFVNIAAAKKTAE
jgi:hypothetical protein